MACWKLIFAVLSVVTVCVFGALWLYLLMIVLLLLFIIFTPHLMGANHTRFLQPTVENAL